MATHDDDKSFHSKKPPNTIKLYPQSHKSLIPRHCYTLERKNVKSARKVLRNTLFPHASLIVLFCYFTVYEIPS